MTHENREEVSPMAAKITFDSDRCKGCELCAAVCPKHIIAVDPHTINRKGITPPR